MLRKFLCCIMIELFKKYSYITLSFWFQKLLVEHKLGNYIVRDLRVAWVGEKYANFHSKIVQQCVPRNAQIKELCVCRGPLGGCAHSTPPKCFSVIKKEAIFSYNSNNFVDKKQKFEHTMLLEMWMYCLW